MKKLIFSFFLMISIGFAQQSPTIIISGTLPAIEDTYVRLSYQQMGSYETMEIPVIDGQFKMEVPNLEAGVYRVVLTWPRSQHGISMAKFGYWIARWKEVQVGGDSGFIPMGTSRSVGHPVLSVIYPNGVRLEVPSA